MAGTNSPASGRTYSMERSNTSSSPVAPQTSSSVARRSTWTVFHNHTGNNSTIRPANPLRSSFESIRPFLPGPQSAVSTFPSSTELEDRSSSQATPSSTSQQVITHSSATNQEPHQLRDGNVSQAPDANSATTPQSADHSAVTHAAPALAPAPVHERAASVTAASTTPLIAAPQPDAPDHIAPDNTTLEIAAPRPLKEWRSWKTGLPWLSLLLLIVLSLIGVIAGLDFTSRHNFGFATQSKAPAFLAHNPAVERAIWSQGILYTALPAFIMAVYRTMWESTIDAFAERQPYVDLRKPGGGPPQSTIMVDYKSGPILYGWVVALRNRHLLLAACMFSSAMLALLVIPLTSFLFTTADFVSNSTFPLSFQTSFNTSILGVFPNTPDLRPSLEMAAAVHLQDASRPRWSDGEYAVPKFVPLKDIGEHKVTLNTTGYSAEAGCIYIPESEYRKKIRTPGETGLPAFTIEVTANDRGCRISNSMNLRLTQGHPETAIRTWMTMSCAPYAGWSRFSILTARYKEASAGVTNFSLISCAPTYQTSSGTLLATTGTSSAPSVTSFTPDPSNVTESRSDAIWRFFEMGIQTPGCFDPSSDVDSNEFGRYVYKLAAKTNATSPLAPQAIVLAANRLFSTTFAVFASTVLLQPAREPRNGTGVLLNEQTRLVVVSPVAYFILAVLVPVAVLNVALFFHARRKSMLFAEPVGMLSMAEILHKSDVSTMVGRLVGECHLEGKTTEAAMRKYKLDQLKWGFHEGERRIVSLPLPSPGASSPPLPPSVAVP